MHTRIACRISVIKRIDLRMWLPIESVARNCTTYIRPGNNRGPISRWKCPKQKTAPRTEINVKIALIYYFFFFRLQFSQHFRVEKKMIIVFLWYKTQFSRCPLKYSKIELLKTCAMLRRFMPDNLCNRLFGVSVGFGLGFELGFSVWASGLLKSSCFFFVCK